MKMEFSAVRRSLIGYMAGLLSFTRREQNTKQRQREQSVRLIRNGLIATGAVVALIIIWLGWFYWSHALVEINLAGLTRVANNVVLSASEERSQSQ